MTAQEQHTVARRARRANLAAGGMRIFYVCNWTGESGGIRVLYDHVKLLRRAGLEASLGSYGEFRRCGWFPSQEESHPSHSQLLEGVLPSDLVVFPEICLRDPEFRDLTCRKVVFVQNPTLMTGEVRNVEVDALLVASYPVRAWLQAELSFQGPMHVVPHFIESNLIHSSRRTQRPARVLVIDRKDKNNGEPRLVEQHLNARGYNVTLIDRRLPRSEFVQLFAQHDIYLHLSYPEGFPISVLEAFGAGAVVVGFTGRGGEEFMQDQVNCLVAPDGDWTGVVRKVKALCDEPEERWEDLRSAARATAIRYDEAFCSMHLLDAFDRLTSTANRSNAG